MPSTLNVYTSEASWIISAMKQGCWGTRHRILIVTAAGLQRAESSHQLLPSTWALALEPKLPSLRSFQKSGAKTQTPNSRALFTRTPKQGSPPQFLETANCQKRRLNPEISAGSSSQLWSLIKGSARFGSGKDSKSEERISPVCSTVWASKIGNIVVQEYGIEYQVPQIHHPIMLVIT